MGKQAAGVILSPPRLDKGRWIGPFDDLIRSDRRASHCALFWGPYAAVRDMDEVGRIE